MAMGELDPRPWWADLGGPRQGRTGHGEEGALVAGHEEEPKRAAKEEEKRAPGKKRRGPSGKKRHSGCGLRIGVRCIGGAEEETARRRRPPRWGRVRRGMNAKQYKGVGLSFGDEKGQV
jgi:hypothetical protein